MRCDDVVCGGVSGDGVTCTAAEPCFPEEGDC